MSIQTLRGEFTYCDKNITEPIEAVLFAETVIRTELKPAKEITLPPLDKYSICKKAGVYSISGYVDFSNQKGRLLRTFFSIQVYKKNNEWLCSNFTFNSNSD